MPPISYARHQLPPAVVPSCAYSGLRGGREAPWRALRVRASVMREAAMARPYSAELRDRVLLAHEHGEGGAPALARRFRIGLSTLYRWLGDLRDEGRRAARPMGRGRAPLGGAAEVLRALVAEQNDATLAEYAERFATRTGQRRSPSAICRAL